MAADTMHTADSEAPSCWICLQDTAEATEPLIQPCRCPRFAHLKCLARWQLQSAGKSEERCCRFCQADLPDWKASLASTSGAKAVSPVMAIKYNGKTYKLRVKPGPDGLRDFQTQVRKLLGFDITDEFNVTFQCSVPETGERMMLSGLNSYGAATHCAAIAAAQRSSVGGRRTVRRSELTHQSHLVDSEDSTPPRPSSSSAQASPTASTLAAAAATPAGRLEGRLSQSPSIIRVPLHARAPVVASAEDSPVGGSPRALSSMSLTRLAVASCPSNSSTSSSSSSGADASECVLGPVAADTASCPAGMLTSGDAGSGGRASLSLLQRTLVRLHRVFGATAA